MKVNDLYFYHSGFGYYIIGVIEVIEMQGLLSLFGGEHPLLDVGVVGPMSTNISLKQRSKDGERELIVD